jgi:hypothetical protein
LRQAYDYWQDQPGNSREIHKNLELRTGNRQEFAAEPELDLRFSAEFSSNTCEDLEKSSDNQQLSRPSISNTRIEREIFARRTKSIKKQEAVIALGSCC